MSIFEPQKYKFIFDFFFKLSSNFRKTGAFSPFWGIKPSILMKKQIKKGQFDKIF